MPVRQPIRLPRQWPEHIKSGILHAISLASVALTIARSRATSRRRLQAEVEQANTEIALLREELYIKDGRWERSKSRLSRTKSSRFKPSKFREQQAEPSRSTR